MSGMNTIDLIIIAALVFFIIMFITGNGDTLMRMFSGKNGEDVYKTYDRERFNRASLLFCIVMLINELAIVFLSDKVPYLGFITLIVTVISFALFIWYVKTKAKKLH